MKIALVYDRVNKWGGAERVLLSLKKIFPDADLFTSVIDCKGASWAKVFTKITPSFLNRISFFRKRHEALAPLMPMAFESLDFTGYDLIISVTSEAAKGIIVPVTTKHICYLLTPTRYLWSGFENYFTNPLEKLIARPILRYLRYWDLIASKRPDVIVAISETVRKRIGKYYNLQSIVIYPPVSLDSKGDALKGNGDYYLLVSRLVAYKKVDIAIRAFNKMGRRLIVVGIGKDEGRLKKIAASNIEFAGFVSDEQLTSYYKGATALIFPQEEDFGIVAVEAQLFGKPVVAYRNGSAVETVIEGKTGVFFDTQDEYALIEGVKKLETISIDPKDCVNNAKRFSEEVFKTKFNKLVSKL